jgi:hypothetical protein
MQPLHAVAPAFVAMAHAIVWCSVATVDRLGRPRSRILHPFWEWDGDALTGWIATGPTRPKRAHLAHSPFVSCSYWNESHDTATAECRAAWALDDATRVRVWNLFKETPPPLGYDPAMVGVWTAPTDAAFAVLRLSPWRLRVFPGDIVLMGRADREVLVWQAQEPAPGTTTPDS